jgi:hypothetical protein
MSALPEQLLVSVATTNAPEGNETMYLKRLAHAAAIATCVGLSGLTGAGIVQAVPLDPPPPTPAPPSPGMPGNTPGMSPAPTSGLPHSGPAGPKGGQPATRTP